MWKKLNFNRVILEMSVSFASSRPNHASVGKIVTSDQWLHYVY